MAVAYVQKQKRAALAASIPRFRARYGTAVVISISIFYVRSRQDVWRRNVCCEKTRSIERPRKKSTPRNWCAAVQVVTEALKERKQGAQTTNTGDCKQGFKGSLTSSLPSPTTWGNWSTNCPVRRWDALFIYLPRGRSLIKQIWVQKSIRSLHDVRIHHAGSFPPPIYVRWY